jgi:hypothetical protein
LNKNVAGETELSPIESLGQYSRCSSVTSLCPSYQPFFHSNRIPFWRFELFRWANIMPGEIHLNLPVSISFMKYQKRGDLFLKRFFMQE